MGKRMRRFLSIILSVAMILGYIPSTGITAHAATFEVRTGEIDLQQ